MPVASELIRQAVTRYADRPAIIDAATDTTYSYSEFGRLVAAMCAQLGPRLEPGDRVAVCARNGVLWAATEAAIACCGLTLVPLNIYLSGVELAELLENSGRGRSYSTRRSSRWCTLRSPKSGIAPYG